MDEILHALLRHHVAEKGEGFGLAGKLRLHPADCSLA
jgi:hypothetical protein